MWLAYLSDRATFSYLALCTASEVFLRWQVCSSWLAILQEHPSTGVTLPPATVLHSYTELRFFSEEKELLSILTKVIIKPRAYAYVLVVIITGKLDKE